MFYNDCFRLSVVNSLNAAPLSYGFKNGLGSDHISLKFQTPSLCADSLMSGEADAGLLSSIEYLKIPNIKIIFGHCIASTRKVRSVLLLAKTQFSAIHTVAMDTSSRTSVVLCQILLKELYGANIKVINMPPDQVAMLNRCDAALLIGDIAMRATQDGLLVIDLAEEWYNWTGLPFVFAVWAVRYNVIKPFASADITTLFDKSFEMGKKNLDAIINEAQPSIGWPRDALREYLTKNILYFLGSNELSGLELFYKKAAQHKFIQSTKPIQFF
jgi:predicted solute-binding protein